MCLDSLHTHTLSAVYSLLVILECCLLILCARLEFVNLKCPRCQCQPHSPKNKRKCGKTMHGQLNFDLFAESLSRAKQPSDGIWISSPTAICSLSLLAITCLPASNNLTTWWLMARMAPALSIAIVARANQLFICQIRITAESTKAPKD